MQRNLQQRRQISKTPFFILHSRKMRRKHVLSRHVAQIIQPVNRTCEMSSAQLFALIHQTSQKHFSSSNLRIYHRAPTPAASSSTTQSYPRSSNSSANSFGPVKIILPASMT